MKKISISELYKTSLDLKPQDLILDVRTPEEFAEGHVPGSQNISHDCLFDRLHELKAAKCIFIYCRSGGRAQFAGQLLSQSGFQNFTVVAEGGMLDWISLGYPTSTK